jgi:hypothetical protein
VQLVLTRPCFRCHAWRDLKRWQFLFLLHVKKGEQQKEMNGSGVSFILSQCVCVCVYFYSAMLSKIVFGLLFDGRLLC